jgi:hypothetical protein
MADYSMTKPCDNCPFRSDGNGVRLRRSRVREIETSLIRGEFPCHKTTGATRGEDRPESEWVHCAGALILLEKLGRPSQMMRIVGRLRMYDARQLDMRAPVVGSFAEMRKMCLPTKGRANV